MISVILPIVALVLIGVYLINKFRKTETKEIFEIPTRDEVTRAVDLKPGEFVEFVNRPERREIEVFSRKSLDAKDRLGIITNYALFRKITTDKLRAKVHAVNRDAIFLQLVNTTDMPSGH